LGGALSTKFLKGGVGGIGGVGRVGWE